MTTTATVTTLPPPRRIVTAHAPLSEDLKSQPGFEPPVVISSDGELEQVSELDGLAQHSYAWMNQVLPSSNNGGIPAIDPAHQAEEINRQGLPRPGVVVRFNELAPGATVPMHRTASTDYNVFVTGSVELVTPATAYCPPERAYSVLRTICNPGDVCVQRGTAHAWHNPSPDSWARWVTCAVQADPVALENGKILDKVFWPEWTSLQ